MTKIEEFLTKFDDQHLANLQCAAEDGRLKYCDTCNCLLHHFNGEYSVTKWEGENGPLARQAEIEFYELGGVIRVLEYPLAWAKATDSKRRRALLPLIHAEWARRAKEVVPAQTTPEFTSCSPAVRPLFARIGVPLEA